MPTYLVVQTFPAKPEALKRERLVEAKNKASAVKFVSDETISAEAVEIADAMRLAQAGVKVEKAGE